MEKEYQRETFQLETDHWWYRARRRIILDQLRHRYPGRTDLRILDIGCGAGTTLRSLRQFGHATGLDASADAARVAEKRSSCPVRVGCIPHDVPPSLERFDVVCLFDVIEHIDDDIAALRCVRNLLTESGTLFVTVPALPWIYGIHDEINHHHRRYSRESLTRALETSGFHKSRISYFNMLLAPLLIPAIWWRNLRRKGHNFELRSRIEPGLQWVLELERHLLRRVRLPIGLSLIAVVEAPPPPAHRVRGASPSKLQLRT